MEKRPKIRHRSVMLSALQLQILREERKIMIAKEENNVLMSKHILLTSTERNVEKTVRFDYVFTVVEGKADLRTVPTKYRRSIFVWFMTMWEKQILASSS